MRRLARLWTRGSPRFARWDRGDVMLPNNLRGETPRYGWLVGEVSRPGAPGIVIRLLVFVKVFFRVILLLPSLAGLRCIRSRRVEGFFLHLDRAGCVLSLRLRHDQQREEMFTRTLPEDVLAEEGAAAAAENQPVFIVQDELDIRLVRHAALHHPIAKNHFAVHGAVRRLEAFLFARLPRCS